MSSDDLIELALNDDSDDSSALLALQQNDSREVFEKAKDLCKRKESSCRVLGVEILMRKPGLSYKREAQDVVIQLAKSARESAVLEVLAYSFSHLDIDDQSTLLERIARDTVAETRMAAAYSLGSLDDALAVDLLIELSRDEDDEVRNWSVFGLQPMHKERPDRADVRDALYARVYDSHKEARNEALLGLAQFKDVRVIAPLIAELGEKTVYELALEAAEAIGHSDLYPALINIKDWWSDNEQFARAIAACSPNSSTNA